MSKSVIASNADLKVFNLINWFDFIKNQIIKYKNKDFTPIYNELFNYLLNEALKKESVYKLFVENGILIETRLNKKEVLNLSKSLKSHLLFGNKTDFRYLLIAQLLYSVNLFEKKINDDFWKSYFCDMGFKESKLSELLNEIRNYEIIKSNKIKTSFNDFVKFQEAQSEYNDLKIFNIVVCATMSAGKSTLVNALLGNDVLPARNEATTAKITTVYDKDGLKHLNAFCKREQEKKISCDINLETLNLWNSDNKIGHICIQGDMNGIKNTDMYAVGVHDTPGTNNSLDNTHCKITMDYLQNEKIDLLIYVANFEQMLTNDEQKLLKEIYSKVINKKKIPVLFVINKVDSYDKQKEDYSDVLSKFSSTLEKLGYDQYQILPVAAKPARLIKMALCGKSSHFSEKECDGFNSIVNKFTKRININEMSSNKVSYNDSFIYGNIDSDIIEIDGESYKSEKLKQALVNTGLIGIEKTIEKYIE